MANKLKEVLKKQGRSQRWLSEQLEIHEVTVNNWCSEKKDSHPSKIALMAIAEVLGVTIKDLVE